MEIKKEVLDGDILLNAGCGDGWFDHYLKLKFKELINIGIWSWGHKRLYSAKELKNKFALKVVKIKYLSHAIVGLFESAYLSIFLQRFTKNDPKNKAEVSNDLSRIKKSVEYKPPTILCKFRDIVIWFDDKIFQNSKKSVGIMIIFQK